MVRCWYQRLKKPQDDLLRAPFSVPDQDADTAVLRVLEQDLLDPAIIERAIQLAISRATAPAEDPEARRKGLEKTLGEVALELERLIELPGDAKKRAA